MEARNAHKRERTKSNRWKTEKKTKRMLRNVNGFVDLHRFIAVPTIIIKNKNSLTPPPSIIETPLLPSFTRFNGLSIGFAFEFSNFRTSSLRVDSVKGTSFHWSCPECSATLRRWNGAEFYLFVNAERTAAVTSTSARNGRSTSCWSA